MIQNNYCNTTSEKSKQEICVILPQANWHIINIFEEFKKKSSHRITFFLWQGIPSHRLDMKWEQPENSKIITTASLADIAFYKRLHKFDHIFLHGIVTPFPKMSILSTLLINTRASIYISAEGFKSRNPNPITRFLLKACCNRNSVTFLAIGNGAANDYRNIGLTKWRYRKFCFAEPYDFCQKNKRRSSDSVEILCVGRMIRRKRFADVIDALRNLEGKNINITMAGNGPELERLKALSKDLPQNISISFPGWKSKEELDQLYQNADIFVLPSEYDGWGVVLNQAIHYRIPSIVSSGVRAGMNNLINHGVNGFVYEDKNLLKKYISMLIADDHLRSKMRKNNDEIAALWSIENIAERLDEVLSDSTVTYDNGPLKIL